MTTRTSLALVEAVAQTRRVKELSVVQEEGRPVRVTASLPLRMVWVRQSRQAEQAAGQALAPPGQDAVVAAVAMKGVPTPPERRAAAKTMVLGAALKWLPRAAENSLLAREQEPGPARATVSVEATTCCAAYPLRRTFRRGKKRENERGVQQQ